MIRVFRHDVEDPNRFVITLELVPGAESITRTVDQVMGMAADAYADKRISAVSITDNPGGNPSLSPDVLGNEIFKIGMDVIVHFTCRDTNRVGLESRALQLAMMGMKNILALTGDYAGTGFGGQGAPVFDLDSVNLICMLSMLSRRFAEDGDPEGFFTGCAISPFKQTRGEGFAQYAKLCKKAGAGARFTITQLGYDWKKFQELLKMQDAMDTRLPTLGSLYYLTPKVARIMAGGEVPGAVVTRKLLDRVTREWQDSREGRSAAIDRAAKLGAILKGLGYRGIHIGGIQKNFDTVGKIIDRMEEIEKDWKDFLPEFDLPQPKGFYFFRKPHAAAPDSAPPTRKKLFHLMQGMHNWFFSFTSPVAPLMHRICEKADQSRVGQILVHLVEDPAKQLLLHCQRCGDCGIVHAAFLCPESQCPKHTRNGPCGGSTSGACEVFPDRRCIWFRAYNRLATVGKANELTRDCVPPRMWELNRSSSWINFHLKRDHQSAASDITRFCSAVTCQIDIDPDALA